MSFSHRALSVSCSAASLAVAMLAASPLQAGVLQEQTPSQEQDTPEPSGANDKEEIIVVGTRASLQSAIARKKNAGTVVDSIVAEDIASFPDKNVGEALSRITGVQLSREFGEGTQVSIRGVEPDLNRIQINGVSQQSALGGRAGDFRELQVELVKSIDVYKGYSVDLPEGGIGGTVSIETRRPLEIKDPIFALKAEAQHLDIAETWQPRLNLTAARSDLMGGRLGVLFNVTHSIVDTRSDFASNTNWGRIADFDRSTEKTIANPDYAGFATYESCAGVTGANASAAQANRLACETQFFDWAPRIARYRNLDRLDKRTSADFQVQYAFADNFSVWGQAQINNRIQQLRDTNYSIDLGRFERFNYDPALPVNALGATSRPRVTQGTATVDNHIVTSLITQRNSVSVPGSGGRIDNVGADSIVGVQRRDFDYNQNTQYYQTGFKWEQDRLKLTGWGAYSKANVINNTNLVAISTGVGGVTVDRRNDAGIPVISFPEAFDPADPMSYANFNRTGANGVPLVQAGPTVQFRPQDAGSSEKLLQLDADYEVDLPFLKMIEFGGQYRDQRYYNYTGGGARLLREEVRAAPGVVAQPAVYQTGANVSYTTVIGAPPASGPAANTYYMSRQQYMDFVRANSGVTTGGPLFSGLSPMPDGAPERLAMPLFSYGGVGRFYDLSRFNQGLVREADGLPQIPAYIIDEKIASGYLKFNFEADFWGMRLTGNAGVRYTYTEDISESANTRRENRVRPGTGVNGIPAVIDNNVTVGVQEISVRNSYHDWLPAVNLNLEVLPNLFVRGTYAQNLARPVPNDLSPSINCLLDLLDTIGTEDTCVAGNPDLQPYRADQYDLNVSWYPNADTIVSLGYYYKDVTSFVIRNQTRSGVDLFRDGVLYTVRQPINGFGAKLDGFELSAQTVFSFLPAPFDGFGASGNFTFARALDSALTNQSTGAPLDGFPGLSKFTWNGRLFYDKDWLNASVTYNRRSEWLVSPAEANFDNNPIFRRGETFIDAKVTFRITDKYNLFVEGLNLGKEYSKTYIDDARPVEYSYPGQRIFIGASAKL